MIGSDGRYFIFCYVCTRHNPANSKQAVTYFQGTALCEEHTRV